MHRTIAALILTVLASGCSKPEQTYEQEIAEWRATKDQFMRGSAESPVPEGDRPAFAPLVYFPISEDYRAPSSLKVAPGNEVIEIPTSTGLRRRMRRIGTLEFTLKGQPLTLTAFIDASESELRRLFVPFGDLTNGTETYPGGRYLDLDRTATGLYDLDFNRAYHPFCVFNAKYDCPVPPKENRLTVPVRAGEKLAARSTS